MNLKEKLYDSCITIRNYCDENNCFECILSRNDRADKNMCNLLDTPSEWPIREMFGREDKNE